MDFSKIIETIETQKGRVNSIQNQADAKTFDDICVILNSTFESIAAIVNVLPVPAKKELIDILLIAREVAVMLQDYKQKFWGVQEERRTELNQSNQDMNMQSTEQAPVAEMPTNDANSMNQTQTVNLSQAMGKSLQLTPPGSIPGQYSQAA